MDWIFENRIFFTSIDSKEIRITDSPYVNVITEIKKAIMNDLQYILEHPSYKLIRQAI